MNPLLLCLGSFIVLSFITTTLFIAASVNSSRMSQIEDGYESEPSYSGQAAPAQPKG
jgi:hypothetical protein